jgi:hypothetical protein
LDIFLFQVIHLHWYFHEFHHFVNYNWSQPINFHLIICCALITRWLPFYYVVEMHLQPKGGS